MVDLGGRVELQTENDQVDTAPERLVGGREKLDDGVWLRALYIDARCSVNRISAIAGCSDAEVRAALLRHGMAMRDPSEGSRWPQRGDRDWMVERLVNQKHTLRDVARELGCSEQTVGDAVREPAMAEALRAAGWDPVSNARAARGGLSVRNRISDAMVLAAVERIERTGECATTARVATELRLDEAGRRALYRRLRELCAQGALRAEPVKPRPGPGRPENRYRSISANTVHTGPKR